MLRIKQIKDSINITIIPTMKEGCTRYLDYVDMLNTSEVNAVVSSSDESVAAVTNWEYVDDDGNPVKCLEVNAKAAGEAVITITRGEYTETFTVTVEKDDTPEEIALIKQRWREYLQDDYTTDIASIRIPNVKALSDSAEAVWNSMNRGFDGELLWETTKTSGGEISCTQIMRLNTLVRAFVTEGTSLYHHPQVRSAISNVLQYWTGTGKHEHILYEWTFDASNNVGFGRIGWWHWEIGIQLYLNPVLLLMEPFFEDEEIVWYTQTLGEICHPVRIESSNGLDNAAQIANSVLTRGLLLNDESLIQAVQTSEYITKNMKAKSDYSSFGTALYADGSFIEHTNIAYNGGYGKNAMALIANFIYLLEGTSYALDSALVESFYRVTMEAYLPLLYKGNFMSMVRGRDVARNSNTEQKLGNIIMDALIHLYKNCSDEEIRATALGVVKYNLEAVVERYGESAFGDYSSLCELLKDDSITSMPYQNSFKVYGAMCRYVKATDTYAAGLALTHNHIASFEGLHDENVHGWYQGTGALYIYNDLEQYFNRYWPTHDPYRITGVTADTTDLGKASGNIPIEHSFAGGATDGNLGAIAYRFNASSLGPDTKANKSYFLLDEGIVQMGTAVSGTTEATIETTIAARILNEAGNNEILIYDAENQIEYLFKDTGEKQKIHLAAGSWIHMEGNLKDGSGDMAYYFPVDTDIEMDVELRVGNYSDINYITTPQEFSCYYLMIGINHGTGTVSDGKYLYVTLPGMSVDGIRDYAANNTLEIVDGVVENGNQSVHFIKNNSGTMMAVNCYSNAIYKADWLKISSRSGRASLIVTEDAGVYTLSVADPSFNATNMNFVSDYKMNVISKSDKITIANSGKGFIVDATNAGGQSFQMTFTLEGKDKKGKGLKI